MRKALYSFRLVQQIEYESDSLSESCSSHLPQSLIERSHQVSNDPITIMVWIDAIDLIYSRIGSEREIIVGHIWSSERIIVDCCKGIFREKRLKE